MRPPKKRFETVVEGDEEEQTTTTPKVIMSKAARRKLKRAAVVVTSEMREEQREELRALRKHLRMVKSNGGRRKLGKIQEKRTREEEMATDFAEDARPRKKGRRLEANEWIPHVQTLPDSMLPKSVAVAEPSNKLPPMPLNPPKLSIPNPIQLTSATNEEASAGAEAVRRPARQVASKQNGGARKRSLTNDEDLW